MRIDITALRSKDAVKDMNREAFQKLLINLQLIPHWVRSVFNSFLSLPKKALMLLAVLLSLDRPIGAGVESFFK